MRVLVCGGRNFGYMLRGVTRCTMAWYEQEDRIKKERKLLTETLDRLSPTAIIHGAARGADELADIWAERNSVERMAFHANWYPRGRSGGLDKSAGPIRNQRMIDEGKPDLVLAFPGGTGTADMVRRARAAGIEVREVSPSPQHGGGAE